MKIILKWVAIFILGFVIIRVILEIVVSFIKWIFTLFANITTATYSFISYIDTGKTILTLIIFGVGFIGYLNHTTNKSYDKSIAKNPNRQNTSSKTQGQLKNEQSQNSTVFNKGLGKTGSTKLQDFVTFAKLIPEKILKELVDEHYNNLYEKYKGIGYFGISGANEFVGSLILSEYQPSLKKRISQGHAKIFTNEWSPHQFSDYMDDIIKSTVVPYAKWSEVYRYLEENHKWIQQHDCAKNYTYLSPKMEGVVYNFTDDQDKITFDECLEKYFPAVSIIFPSSIQSKKSMFKLMLSKYDGSYELNEPSLGALIMLVQLGEIQGYDIKQLFRELNWGPNFEDDVIHKLIP